MARVIVYTDFDGTFTRKSGNQTVFTSFYQSLLSGYQPDVINNHYKRTPLKSPEEVQILFEQKFGTYAQGIDFNHEDAGMLMPPEAVAFFHEFLKNDDVKIVIVTKNRCDYIQALFKYQGFSAEEIARLLIKDSGNKYKDVDTDLKLEKEKATALFILDDDLKDFYAMVFAALGNSYSEDQVRKYHKDIGQFEWLRYLEEIKTISAPKQVAEAVASLTQNDNPDKSAFNSIFSFLKGAVYGLIITVPIIGILLPVFGFGIITAGITGGIVGFVVAAISILIISYLAGIQKPPAKEIVKENQAMKSLGAPQTPSIDNPAPRNTTIFSKATVDKSIYEGDLNKKSSLDSFKMT